MPFLFYLSLNYDLYTKSKVLKSALIWYQNYIRQVNFRENICDWKKSTFYSKRLLVPYEFSMKSPVLSIFFKMENIVKMGT